MATRVIDCHAHFGHFSQTNILYPDASAMVRAMDIVDVEKLCISSFLSIGPDCRAGNDMVAGAVKRYPDRFIGYAVVNPNRPEEIEVELQRCFGQLAMRAIKLHPAFHKYPIDGPAYRLAFDYAGRHGIAILSHEWGTPQFLEALAGEYPKVNFIIAHTGFWDGRGPFHFRGVLERRKNVFVDLVYSKIYYCALENMVEYVGAEKILWGSDFPLHDLPYQLGRMLFSRLNDSDKQKILGENMLGILGGSE
jgi:uncharacterized protein